MLEIAAGAALMVAAVTVFFLLRSKTVSKLDPRVYEKFKLLNRVNVSHNTIKLRFGLAQNATLGLPIGKHIMLRAEGEDGKQFSRPYTPVTPQGVKGYFELVVKVYPNGKMSGHLNTMKEGEMMEIKGPLGSLEYHGNGSFTIKEKKKQAKRVGLLCGGTGITPMLQIARNALADPSDQTQFSMIFANVTEDDILLRDELDSLSQKFPLRFKVFYTLDKPPASGWKYGSGFVTSDMIQQHLPANSPDTLILCCGPPPMMNFMEKNLKSLDFEASNYYIY
eukprot:g51157.t1